MNEMVTLKLDGREYVVLARREYERLVRLARLAEKPARRSVEAVHEVPAVDYARTSIADEIVLRRAHSDLTQRDLAKLAGVRVETLCRIETGKHTASTDTIAKLEQALVRAEADRKRRRKRA